MGLAERAASFAPKVNCKSCIWYESLSAKDKAGFHSLVARSDLPRSDLHAICRDEGLSAELTSFKRHLNEHVAS